MRNVLKGDIVYVDLGDHYCSCVQSGVRPCLVIGAYYTCDAVNVLPLTKRLDKTYSPMHVLLQKSDVKGYLKHDSLILAEQITTIDRRKIIHKLGHVSGETDIMKRVEIALKERYDMAE